MGSTGKWKGSFNMKESGLYRKVDRKVLQGSQGVVQEIGQESQMVGQERLQKSFTGKSVEFKGK